MRSAQLKRRLPQKKIFDLKTNSDCFHSVFTQQLQQLKSNKRQRRVTSKENQASQTLELDPETKLRFKKSEFKSVQTDEK